MEEIVRQVGHLPELYKDAQSEKYKKKKNFVIVNSLKMAPWCQNM
jgi:hypothetical protein